MGIDDVVVAGRDLKRILHGAIVDRLTRPAPIAPTPGGDGEQTCRRCAPLIEQSSKHRAEDQLIVNGPMSAQEAVLTRHLIQRAALAREKGKERFRAFVPELVEQANVSAATVTRTFNKLRHADQATLPIAIDDVWEEGKLKVYVTIPKTIGDEPWSERRAYLAMSRATLGDGDGRKKQGGSEAATKARWRCPDHPGGSVAVTVHKFYRCVEPGCERAHADAPVTVRLKGDESRIQVEGGSDDRDIVDIFGDDCATEVTPSGHQDDGVNPVEEERIQVEGGSDDEPSPPPVDLFAQAGFNLNAAPTVSFVSHAEAELAAGPRYIGEAHPDDLAALQAAAELENAPPRPVLVTHHVAPLSDRPWYSKARQRDETAPGRPIELSGHFRQPTDEEYAAAVPGAPDPTTWRNYRPCCGTPGMSRRRDDGGSECFDCGAVSPPLGAVARFQDLSLPADRRQGGSTVGLDSG
jgi:hypothetical protein